MPLMSQPTSIWQHFNFPLDRPKTQLIQSHFFPSTAELFSTEFASNKKTCFLVQTIASRGVIDVITVAYCDEEFGPATVSDLFTNFNNSARNIEEEMG